MAKSQQHIKHIIGAHLNETATNVYEWCTFLRNISETLFISVDKFPCFNWSSSGEEKTILYSIKKRTSVKRIRVFETPSVVPRSEAHRPSKNKLTFCQLIIENEINCQNEKQNVVSQIFVAVENNSICHWIYACLFNLIQLCKYVHFVFKGHAD